MEFDRVQALFEKVRIRLLDPSVKEVLLVSPVDPDADSCMSIICFRGLLEQLGERRGVAFQCHLWAPNKPKANSVFGAVRNVFLPEDISSVLPDDRIDLCVIFDCGDFSRTKLSLEHPSLQTAAFVAFDHHPLENFPQDTVGISVAGPSTTVLIFRFFSFCGVDVSADTATCLFVGLACDTGKFGNALATAEAFEMAALLMRAGARSKEVFSAMMARHPVRRFQAQMLARRNIWFSQDLRLAFLWFSQRDLELWGATTEDVLALEYELRTVAGVEVVARYYERSELKDWYCSLRSYGGCVTAEDIASAFGGGGHRQAAAFALAKGSPDFRRPGTLFNEISRFLSEKNESP